MGVPAFYRWLSEKYPKIVTNVMEKRNDVIEGIAVPLNLLEENPNGIVYDNLYVDMNGLIHPCSHPEDREAPTTEAEMYVNVTKYVDRLFAAVRPRKVLFLAIDGVAPRAKMNQQRSRRFRAVKDTKERQKVMEEVMQDMKDLGLQAPEGHGMDWDSNVITPGTEFMSNLSLYLRFYVLDRMNKNPAWRNIKVILSDASEPGEGEHKIMNFVRAQRAKPGYDPNQRHILHGLDADLIMLALATHEPHFTILRELVSFGGKKEADKPERSEGQKLLDAQSTRNMAAASAINPHDEWVYGKPLQALNVSVLRDYLFNEFKCLQSALPFGFDFERIIDDFVFMCFFVGNDFLPHLPSLDIRDGAIDFLIESYKEMLPSLGNYITSPGGKVNLVQADVILGRVGEVEDEIFRRKKGAEDSEERRRASWQKNPQRGLGGVILPPKDRARAEAESMNKMAKEGLVTKPLGARPANTYRADHTPTPNTAPSSTPSSTPSAITAARTAATAKAATAATAAAAAKNKEAAKKFKGSILGKRKTAVTAVTAETTDTTSAVKIEVVVEGEAKAEGMEAEEVEVGSTPDDKKIKVEDGSAVAVIVPKGEKKGESEEEKMEEEIEGKEESINQIESIEASEEKEEEDEMLFEPKEEKEEKAPLTESEKLRAKEDIKKRMKAKEGEMIDGYKQSMKDKVCLHEAGWKSRYYEDPFKKENLAHGGGLTRMCSSYVEGLCWVMKYYYQGVPSWNWYYPFHYAPFASDLINIDNYAIDFELSEPFRPVEQLLAVLPAESVNALPQACRMLMVDPGSEIFDLYGSDAPIDPNGKHLPWLWVLLLPFVDEKRVVKAFNNRKEGLTVEECRRNAFGVSLVFVHSQHKLAIEAREKIRYRPVAETDPDVLHAQSKENEGHMLITEDAVIETSGTDGTGVDGVGGDGAGGDGVVASDVESHLFDHTVGDGISGTLSAPPMKWFTRVGPDAIVPAPYTPPPMAFHDLRGNQVLCFTFASPAEVPGSHKSQLLPGVILQVSELTSFDLMARKPPRLNRGGFNIVDLAGGLRKGPNQNNILRYGGNHEHGGDGSGHYPNQRQYQNGGAQPQQFLQHFQQQQQQYSNNNNNRYQQSYGYDMAQRANGGRNDNNNNYNNNRNNRNDGPQGYGGGGGGGGSHNYNDRGGYPQQDQNQNQNNFSHRQPSYGDFNKGRAYPQQGGQGVMGGQGGNFNQQSSSGYQQQQQYSGAFVTAQAMPLNQTPQGGPQGGRFSFSSGPQGGQGPPPRPVSMGSMDSMRAQLAQTLQQQGGNKGSGNNQGRQDGYNQQQGQRR